MLLRIGVPLVLAVALATGALLIASPDPPQAAPETLGQYADRTCASKQGDARDLCRDKILLRRLFDR